MTAIALTGNVLPAFATTYIVDTALDPGPGGTTSLRQAVFQANASANNVVQFAPALNGSTLTLQNGEVAVTEPMYIAGPGPDKLTISGNDASRIFNISNVSATPIAVTLSGLTLTHGNASGNFGGAILAQNVSLTLKNSVLDYNAAVFGAGISSTGNNATVNVITGTTISRNTATYGGGLYFSGGGHSSLHIADSVLDSNTGTKEFGGGRLYELSSLIIERTRITNNKSQILSGGGLSIDGHNASYPMAQISGSTITGNTAANNGGGLALFRVEAILASDTISGNSGNNGGGVFVFDPDTVPTTSLSLQQSTISGNNGSTFGGGIYVERALSVSISRSLISGNNAYGVPTGGGGGIAIGYVKIPTEVNDSTIYANYAYNNGGGVGIFDTSGTTYFNGVTIANNFTFNYASNGILGAGKTSLYNCVVANNFSHAGNQDLDGVFYVNYSLVRNAGTAFVVGLHNKFGLDPALGPLAVNGGPTQTMLPAPTSPLLDAGGASLAGSDQRGLPRNVNGRRDMGAVERQNPEEIIFRNGFDSS